MKHISAAHDLVETVTKMSRADAYDTYGIILDADGSVFDDVEGFEYKTLLEWAVVQREQEQSVSTIIKRRSSHGSQQDY